MVEHDWLAERFDANRGHLRADTYRMLGSQSDADDAVQETWLRLSRADTSDVENLGVWLTTVVARVCLDMLRSRKSHRKEPLVANGLDPIVDRNTAATRKLASRARRRVQGAATTSDPDRARHREIVDAFLEASRDGDFEALLAMLDPNVVLRADPTVVEMGAVKEVRGATAVAETFKGRARVAQIAFVEGAVGAVWAQDGQPRVVFDCTIADGKIVEIELLADPALLGQLEWTVLAD
jgi:DNA-directed RNA polymerase specialized sigma24 family protein